MIRSSIPILALAMMCVVGCGEASTRPELFAVSGTVKLNGNPVEGATVTFASTAAKAARSASGKTDAQVNFKLTTYDTNDGAIAGEHTVTISKTEAANSTVMTQENAKEMMMKNTGMMSSGKLADFKPADQLPVKYADPKTSGEKRTVVKGEANNFNFDLTE